MGDVASWAGVVVYFLAFIVAIISLVISRKAQRQANDLQERIVKIEEQKEQDRQAEAKMASLRAALIDEGNTLRLDIINNGKTEAKNIRVEIGGNPLIEHPNYLKNIPLPDLVGPHSNITFVFEFEFASELPNQIKITWDDEYAKGRTYSTTLTL